MSQKKAMPGKPPAEDMIRDVCSDLFEGLSHQQIPSIWS